MTIGAGVALMLACVALEAFFSGSEIAMVHADRVSLRTRADEGDKGAARALELLQDEASLLGTCLIGTNLCTVTGSSVAATLLLAHGWEQAWAPVALFLPLTLVFGEALPKTVMQFHANTVVPWVAHPLGLFRSLLRPFLAVVQGWSRVVSRLTGARVDADPMTRKELLDLLASEQEGPIDPEERRLIRGVLELQELTVADAMTPLVRVAAVAQDATVGVAADVAVRTQHSRLPVYRGRIDHIVGIVHQADLLFVPDDATPLLDHVRPVAFVPDAKPADQLFAEMRASGEHFAVIVDEYGGCVGIVTLEDLLELVVGDIEDERDVVGPTLLQLDDGSWSMPGHLEVDEVAERTGVPLPEGDYETVAGLILSRLGQIPATGAVVEFDGVRLRVEEASDRAIRRVRLVPAPAAADA